MKNFEVTENRIEQWETEFGIPELGIYGSGQKGLIQKLANEVYRLREEVGNYKLQKEKLKKREKKRKKRLEKPVKILNRLNRLLIENNICYDGIVIRSKRDVPYLWFSRNKHNLSACYFLNSKCVKLWKGTGVEGKNEKICTVKEYPQLIPYIKEILNKE